MRIPIPFLISDRGYGILVDCGSLMTFNDDCRGSWLYLDMIEQLDIILSEEKIWMRSSKASVFLQAGP